MSVGMLLNSSLAASFGQEIVYLFQEMNVAAAICLGIGLILLIIEIFTPGFGLFGIAGVIMSIIGIVLRATAGGRGNPVFQVLLLLLLLLLLPLLPDFPLFGFLLTYLYPQSLSCTDLPGKTVKNYNSQR